MEASALIQEKVDEDAKIVVGALYDDALGDDLQVTVIATGIGDVLKKKETIAQVDDLYKKKPIREPEVQTTVIPAQANRHPRVAPLPGSNFDTFENLGVSNINEARGAARATAGTKIIWKHPPISGKRPIKAEWLESESGKQASTSELYTASDPP